MVTVSSRWNTDVYLQNSIKIVPCVHCQANAICLCCLGTSLCNNHILVFSFGISTFLGHSLSVLSFTLYDFGTLTECFYFSPLRPGVPT